MIVLHFTLLVLLLLAIAVAIARLGNLVAVAILSGLYSLVLASVFVLLDAVDVAFTEAAVGAGVTLTLMLAAISLTSRHERIVSRPWRNLAALGVCLGTAACMIYASLGMPAFGDPQAPAQTHVGPHYVGISPTEIGIPNMVTSVLASYRGFDTLGEAIVVFTAGVAIIALLWRWQRPRP